MRDLKFALLMQCPFRDHVGPSGQSETKIVPLYLKLFILNTVIKLRYKGCISGYSCIPRTEKIFVLREHSASATRNAILQLDRSCVDKSAESSRRLGHSVYFDRAGCHPVA